MQLLVMFSEQCLLGDINPKVCSSFLASYLGIPLGSSLDSIWLLEEDQLSAQRTALCGGGWAAGMKQSRGALSWAASSKASAEGALSSPRGDPLRLGKPSPCMSCFSTWEPMYRDWKDSTILLPAYKRELENNSQYFSSWRIVKQMFHFL